MGIANNVLRLIEANIRQSLGDSRGLQMLELGNQELEVGSRERTAKRHFEQQGVIHTSIDLNGQDGALVVDLAQPTDRAEWSAFFDVITNCGTTEHVDPHAAQYEAFKNIHTWLRVGGIAIHVLPDVQCLEENGRWRGHCNNYYSKAFVTMLADSNDYELVSLHETNALLAFCLSKRSDQPFMSDRAKFLSHIAYRKGGQRVRGKLRELGLYPRRSTLVRLQRLLGVT
jgi:hypothetical protein